MAIQAINQATQMPKTESKQNVNFNGFLDSKAFEKVAEFAGKNPATFNAASSLIMAGVLRPAAIMALPAKDEQEQKNKGVNKTMKELILFELSTKLGTNFGGGYY